MTLLGNILETFLNDLWRVDFILGSFLYPGCLVSVVVFFFFGGGGALWFFFLNLSYYFLSHAQ